MKKKRWLPLLILLLSLLCSMALYVEKEAEFSKWLSTSGQVESVVFHKRKKASKSSYTISYSYEVENVLYHGANTYNGRSSDFSAGAVTEIWYDPADPQNSSFHRPNTLSHNLTPLALGAVAAVLIYRKQQ